MVRVPRHSSNIKFNFDTNRNFKNIISLKYSGETRDYGNGNNSFADVILDDYFLVNYGLKYNLLNNAVLYFDVDNVFNNNYEQAFMYSSMGRSLNFGLRKTY